MAIDPKLSKLIAALAEATRDGRLRWTDTADEDAFRLTLPNSMVRIRRFRRAVVADLKPLIEVTLMDAKGKIVEEWRVQSQNSFPNDPEHARQDDDFSVVDDLLRIARSSARKSDDLIDQIVREVREDQQLGVG